MPIPVKNTKKFTYKDYLDWSDNERWELIEGIPYNMTPAPSRIHQSVLGELHRQISNYLLNRECNVYIAPFDVILSKEEKYENIDTVVQPDIVVICDKLKLSKNGCNGSPDLIIEIVSPSTARKDSLEKFNLYEKNGVREYWIVRPEEKIVMVFNLDNSAKYGRPQTYSDEEQIKVELLGDLTIELQQVFRE